MSASVHPSIVMSIYTASGWRSRGMMVGDVRPVRAPGTFLDGWPVSVESHRRRVLTSLGMCNAALTEARPVSLMGSLPRLAPPGKDPAGSCAASEQRSCPI